jgi:Uma2 family endonuclease
MVQTQVEKPISFETFLAWYPEDGCRYELIEGVIVEILPTGPHEDVSGFLVAELNAEIRRNSLPYSIPRTCLIKPQAEGSGYVPDVVVLNRDRLPQEPLWPTASVIQYGVFSMVQQRLWSLRLSAQTGEMPLNLQEATSWWNMRRWVSLNIGWSIFVRWARCAILASLSSPRSPSAAWKVKSTKYSDLCRATS